MESKELLLGNGEKKMKILHDKWIYAGLTINTNSVFDYANRVNKLFKDKDNTWDIAIKICRFFRKEEATTIMAAPIASHTKEDSMFWPHTKEGNYTVRSRYKITFKGKESSYQQEENSTMPNED